MDAFSRSLSFIAIAALLLSGLTTAEPLVSCHSIESCSSAANSTNTCNIGEGHSLRSVGSTSFTSRAIENRNLTWTVGAEYLNVGVTRVGFRRLYLLGTPPDVDLSNNATTNHNNLSSCALFFEGISQGLQFGETYTNLDYAVGTCGEAFRSNACAADLLSQAQKEIVTLIPKQLGPAKTCSGLRDALVNQAPPSCSQLTNNGTWGRITNQVFTGDVASAPLVGGTCHPTTGPNYALSIVNSEDLNLSLEDYSREAYLPFLRAITPVITVLYDAKTTLNSIAPIPLADPFPDLDVSLDCLKALPLKAPVANGSGGRETNSAVERQAVGATALALVAVTVLAFILG